MKAPRNPRLLPSILLFVGMISVDLSICMAQSPWTQKADMPTTMAGHASCKLNNKIYVLGGANSQGTTLNSMHVYDPVLDSWTSKSGMAQKRIGFPVIVFDGKILAIGGSLEKKSGPLASIEEYDPVSDIWTHKADMPRARLSPTATMVDSMIYIIGGCSDSFTPIAEVDIYDPMTGDWTTAADLLTPRHFSESVVLNGMIYVLGGEKSAPWPGLHTVEAYDPNTDTWSSKADMITQRKNLIACVVKDNIYVFGGSTNNCSGILSSVEVYDQLADTWTECASMPVEIGKSDLSVTVLDSIAYISGGLVTPCEPSSITNTMYEYNHSYDLHPLIKETTVDKYSVKAGIDSVRITSIISDPSGIRPMVILRDPDVFYLDSLQLYDDGNHGDGAARDSLFANYWKIRSDEEMQYYMDIKITKIGADTVINYINSQIVIATDELVTSADFSLKNSTCNSFLGNCIWTDLYLQNNSSQYAATNIKAKLESLDSIVSVFNPTQLYDVIPSGDNTPPASFQLIISEDFSGTRDVPIVVHISSYDHIFRSDTFHILVQDPDLHVPGIQNAQVQIYPNPTNGVLTLEIKDFGEHSIEITSLNGQLMYSREMEGTSHHLDLSNFRKGVYLISVRSKDFAITRKIIKLF